ncbi:lipoprotein signal peptidase [Hallella multisaccharivorax DSM 17128]|uniref:Lipoprotein signal peptidase n=1 Tax=Hallella multisaccharivorax DSM 17128 TaxID=688246 RepID=F8N6G1_9BACT|nr:lipoprotein signal peptidase [Hallella multisaccharivorax]EGN57266.1 signal peptidase II [Hallella multisaccharivorax DSM 17128]GJG31496.1 lipoprotein signal peptidase [Hallella multisaccharivorax DSM 17128]
MKRKGLLAWIIIIAILIIDQLIKIHVKTTMTIGESIRITDWFYITFIENNGMAWGMTFVNKLFLSLLRLVAVSAIGWFIWQVVRQKGRTMYIVFLSMVLAGAAGNILDSLFYGLCFTASTPYSVSYAVPFGSGYAGVLMGKVVDMFYFPIIHSTWPSWMPLVGGESFTFFSPVFNFADASITTGVICLLLFCSKDLALIGATIDKARGKYTRKDEKADKPTKTV